MQRKLLLLLCLSSFFVTQIGETGGTASIHVKSSEENSSEELLFQTDSSYQAVDTYLQQADMTPQPRDPRLYQQSQPRCGCLQVIFLRVPQYQCQCGGAQEWVCFQLEIS
ncbi:unnamed protein product [Angiostrongylus costaricensis]|uniref:Defensin_propep domain-containing protein n=1 Tax=Angiostrongylus costaricensis TaxID=334426 RepID=A0A0R3PQC2_ANGCS|nr:unnamed protein product [Angiostrongylus costaricensis]